MPKFYTITYSPCADDETPFAYEEGPFVAWVDEVFMEGYKKGEDAPFPSPDECLSILEGAGYEVEVTDA